MALDNWALNGTFQLTDSDLTWGPMANGDTGQASPEGCWSQAWGTATGTFGVAGSVQLEGSNDGTNWFKLSPAALTAAGSFLLAAQERPRFIRPHVTAGDGTTALIVIVKFK